MSRPMFRQVDCWMDGCRCGQPHPAYRDCPICLGTGYFIGGDQYNPCPRCAAEDRKARRAAEDAGLNAQARLMTHLLEPIEQQAPGLVPPVQAPAPCPACGDGLEPDEGRYSELLMAPVHPDCLIDAG